MSSKRRWRTVRPISLSTTLRHCEDCFIQSEGDYAAGKAIVEKYAVKVDPELHKEVKERYNALGLKPYGGFINPEIVPVMENGKVVDYKIEYPSDFVAQHLKYGKEYSFLKAKH